MVRTQIQLPDAIHLRAKQVAEAKEISLAELTRRGLELILDQYPSPEELSEPWELPIIDGMGWTDPTPEQLKDAAQMTRMEEELEEAARSHAGL
ncbi:MAG: hypothetical protein KDD47_18575 [Acidobacteria bacterium]|nr:hypothetical protein [Acidobacteriota bacterium]